ncbi:hypothetical protein NUW58_g1999 [Xylaria curta]|uniref:Uncharacterized protein n=1 Tax=Xylaria curta TaxID=42375 RepID=A0ACC1PI80_9PEZI|nr:hypothetical protein NUW58_g1999 [Xylaria curta]
MASLLSKLNPVPRFPEFTGPYKVGTVDIEIPVCELESPAPAPDNAADIETVQFRIFYPCDASATSKKRITWLPAPQRDYLSAYIKFLGVGPLLAEAASFLPRHLHYTSIPVVDNAPILKPQAPSGRWPTMLFSHGLGGNRNAYSQVVGSLASHGVVVFCPEHRDGSSIASFIRVPYQQARLFSRTKRLVPYAQIAHDATDEVHELRNAQLRIRLWELGLIHAAMLNIDEGAKFTNLNKSAPSLEHLSNQLQVHEPGSIIFAGHSFGAASVVQFLKSGFYAGRPELETMEEPLYTPNWESAICKQVTQQNVTILLDMWCFPLLAKSTKPLFNLPLPVYAPSHSPSAFPKPPGGNAILAVESEDFFKWKEHLHATARALSPDPSAPTVAPLVETSPPHFFYVKGSAHLSQSDFALLFPWLTRKVLGSDAPGRVMRLNLRALLQVLRVNGVPVAETRARDLVDNKVKLANAKTSVPETETGSSPSKDETCADDAVIFEREGNATREDETATDELVQAWRWIDVVGMGDHLDVEGKAKKKGDAEKGTQDAVDETESKMAGVMEPSVSPSDDRKVDWETVGVFAATDRDTTS